MMEISEKEFIEFLLVFVARNLHSHNENHPAPGIKVSSDIVNQANREQLEFINGQMDKLPAFCNHLAIVSVALTLASMMQQNLEDALAEAKTETTVH